MGFEQKPPNAVQKTNKDNGDMVTLLIEKHEKDADLRKMVGIYKKAVGAEVVSSTDEGVTIRYSKEAAAKKNAQWQAQGNNSVRRDVQTVSPDAQHANIVEMGKNTVESVSTQELLGSN